MGSCTLSGPWLAGSRDVLGMRGMFVGCMWDPRELLGMILMGSFCDLGWGFVGEVPEIQQYLVPLCVTETCTCWGSAGELLLTALNYGGFGGDQAA